jgi:hypothetical protein
MTRREFFNFCKRDTLRDVFRSWNTFQAEVKESTKLSCEEAAMRFARKAQNPFKFPNKKMKGGI